MPHLLHAPNLLDLALVVYGMGAFLAGLVKGRRDRHTHTNQGDQPS